MRNPLVQAQKWLAQRKTKRSPLWPRTRAEHLWSEPWCRGCGAISGLEVHHIIPFHIHPATELDPANLITLCENIGRQCHFRLGHRRNWKSFNRAIREQATAQMA